MLVVTLRYTFYVAYTTQNKSQARALNFAQLNTSLSKLVLPVNSLYQDDGTVTWHDDNKELSINGSYYEVVGIRTVKDSVVVFLLEDENESRFERLFFKQSNQYANEQEDSQAQLDWYFELVLPIKPKKLDLIVFQFPKLPDVSNEKGYCGLLFVPPETC